MAEDHLQHKIIPRIRILGYNYGFHMANDYILLRFDRQIHNLHHQARNLDNHTCVLEKSFELFNLDITQSMQLKQQIQRNHHHRRLYFNHYNYNLGFL